MTGATVPQATLSPVKHLLLLQYTFCVVVDVVPFTTYPDRQVIVPELLVAMVVKTDASNLHAAKLLVPLTPVHAFVIADVHAVSACVCT